MASPASTERFLELIKSFAKCPIAVYGDLVADEFVFGEISRVSREAPVLILNHRESRIVPGGAANAVNNLQALGAIPLPIGILGKDDHGQELWQHFREKKIQLSMVRRASSYQTPTKTRFLAGSAHSSRQQVLRLDRESRFQHTPATRDELWMQLQPLLKQCRGVIISDYDFGFVSRDVVFQIAKKRNSLPVTLDSRHGLLLYSGLTSSTPNEPEVEEALRINIGNDLTKLEWAGKTLLKRQKLEALLITRGRHGMALFASRQAPVHIPICGTDEIADVTGAGDTVIAVFTLALAVGATFLEAARLSNYAGGIVVMKRGTATVTAAELEAAVLADRSRDS
jgi:D-glycero-beta-D-manno-heptose-7-phosphate kinase